MDLCIQHLAMLCGRFNIDLRVQHIKGVDNIVADALYQGKGGVIWEVVPHELFTVF